MLQPPSRIHLLTRNIIKSDIGVEIGPLHNPLAPKRNGYNSLSMDISTREDLILSYSHLSEEEKNRIEQVDIIFNDSFYESLVSYTNSEESILSCAEGSLDYIISSHNCEHLPNPIRFLQDCEMCLKDNGLLVMAIPIASRCFDVAKPLSSTGDLLDAFIEDRKKPPFGKVWDHLTNMPLVNGAPVNLNTFDLRELSLRETKITPSWYNSLLGKWKNQYMNCHCWQFNVYSFELIFRELQACGFFPSLELSCCNEMGLEFMVEFTKSARENEMSDVGLISSRDRSELLKKSIEMLINDINR